MQGSGWLVSMNLAELGESSRKVTVARDALLEHLHVAGAIHRLDCIAAAIDGFRREHVLAEALPMAGCLPQRPVHQLGGIDLLVTRLELTFAHVVEKLLEQAPALRVPEDRARRLFLEMKQVHRPPQATVIPLFGLFELMEILLELLLVRPRRAVNALQHRVPSVTAPVCARHAKQAERLSEATGRRKMWSPAKVDKLALPIQRDRFVRRDVLDDLRLVFLSLVAKESNRFIAVTDFTHDRLIAVHDAFQPLFDDREVLGREWLVSCEVVIEPVLDRGTDGHLCLGPQLLDGLGKH